MNKPTPVSCTLLLSAALSPSVAPAQEGASVSDSVRRSEAAAYRVEVVVDGLREPSGLDFLPDGRAILAERIAGRMRIVDVEQGTLADIENVPETFTGGDGGPREVVVHPDYARTGWIYFSYTTGHSTASTLVVDRARLRDNRLVDRERLFEAEPAYEGGLHYAGRLALHEGYLFVSIGDRYNRSIVQDLGTHNGKVVRLHEDGTVPDDNPFVDVPGALPEIWSYGHRNPQGMTVHGSTGAIWTHEHGPAGGDEINIVRPGRNYGWPVITYGEEYEGGPIGEGITSKPGMEQPLYYYRPSIAPSGMEFYTGTAFPDWRGDLFIGAMALTHLNRLVVHENRVLHEERLLEDESWRIRVVRQGPDGLLYLGVDEGLLVRLAPAEEAIAGE